MAKSQLGTLSVIARYLIKVTLDWFEIFLIFGSKEFEMSKSSAQLLYGFVLVI